MAKEWRELLASRSFWIMLAVIGPLVGVSFISAVTVYGELSAAGGTAEGVGEAFSPLVGVWAPTFSACELAAALLLPFVAIRVISGDRQSGALLIEHQHPLSPLLRVAAKGAVLAAGWLVASAAPVIGVLLWLSYGGSVYVPELLIVMAGHLLNAALTIALALAAASVTEHPSSAAIVTLTITVGTWLLNFAAAVNGGWWERAAAYTPTAMVAEFQRGLLRMNVVLVAAALIALGLALAATWLQLHHSVRQRLRTSLALLALAAVAVTASVNVHASWDASENRQNSFSRADEALLSGIHGPLRMAVHLAPEDPRRSDLEVHVLRKLRRILPQLHVEYLSKTTVGLFEQASDHYGEIWYEFEERRQMSRITTAEGVLDAIVSVTRVAPSAQPPDEVFRGHPLEARPRGAPVIFYGVWPVAVAALAFYVQRRHL
jgi:ABC-type transport system involved in multi-copper enzyme maturation permease subunit